MLPGKCSSTAEVCLWLAGVLVAIELLDYSANAVPKGTYWYGPVWFLFVGLLIWFKFRRRLFPAAKGVKVVSSTAIVLVSAMSAYYLLSLAVWYYK